MPNINRVARDDKKFAIGKFIIGKTVIKKVIDQEPGIKISIVRGMGFPDS